MYRLCCTPKSSDATTGANNVKSMPSEIEIDMSKDLCSEKINFETTRYP